MEVDGRAGAVFSHADLGALLRRFVSDGGVRYEAWSRDVVATRQLDGYLERLARVSPDTAPNLFPTPADRALYWLCAYNAFAIRSILAQWPVASVLEVEAGWGLAPGRAYYRKARFQAGGRKASLHAIAGARLPAEALRDARVLLLLSCGSASAAPVQADLPTAVSLEGLLASATARFLSDPANLRVIHPERRMLVSPVLRRGRRMIAADPRSGQGRAGDAIRRWLHTVSPPSISADLALAGDYAVDFLPWDWTVNAR